MGKVLRLIFSRFTLVFLAIVLQVAAAIAVAYYLSSYYRVMSIVSTVVMIFTLLLIINRDMTCDAKLPWSILVSIVPIVGFLLYLMFSRNYASLSERKMFRLLPQMKFVEHHPNAPAKYLRQVEYLKSVGAPTFSETDTRYFSCGEQFLEDFLQELDKAQKFVFLEYFIVEEGKMLSSILEVLRRKIACGVEVRLLYDDVGSLTHVKRKFYKQMRKEGIWCAKFAPLRPMVSAVYNNRDHRKIAVIDGKVGYMSGLNIADEYINHTHPFGYWKDSAVKLSGNAVTSLCTMFLQMFDMAVKQREDFDKYLVRSETDDFADKGLVTPFGDGPNPLYPEQLARGVYLNLIDQALYDLYISTPYLIVDESVTESLRRAAMRGVNVNVIIPAIPDKKTVYAMTKQSCKKLIKAGVKIYSYTDGFIHAKNIVADGIAGVVGTINLDYRSFVHHYECGVYMYDTLAVRQMYEDLTETCKKSKLLDGSFRLKLWEKLVCMVTYVFRPML